MGETLDQASSANAAKKLMDVHVLVEMKTQGLALLWMILSIGVSPPLLSFHTNFPFISVVTLNSTVTRV